MTFRAVVFTLVLTAGAPSASGQDLWGEIRLPGRASAARQVMALGDSDGRLDATWLLDFTRRHHASVGGSDWQDKLSRYVRFVADAKAAVEQWPAGLSISPMPASKERDRLKDCLELLGLKLKENNKRYSVVVDDSGSAREHAGWLAANGIDVAKLAVDLNAGKPAIVTLVDTVLPLPLPQYWRAVFGNDRNQVIDIAKERTSALLYSGLMPLDDETLTFLAAHADLVQQLGENVGPSFAAFSRSFRIRHDIVETPGGSEAAPLWEALAGSRPDQPERFVRELFGRDGGRLAFFYDAVGRLDASRQAFALGAHLTGAARVAFVQDVYHVFATATPGWNISIQPFRRPDPDPAVMLAFLDVRTGGVVGPAWWPAFFEHLTASRDWPEHPDEGVRAVPDRDADARWALGWLFEVPTEAGDRFQMLRLAQRDFPAVARESAPLLESAIRAVHDMPALALALERMGIRDLELIAKIGRAAHTLTASDGKDAVVPVLRRWQAAFGLIEQVQRRRRLPAPLLASLLSSLADVALIKPDRAAGSMATWVCDHLVPAFGLERVDADDMERSAIDAFVRDPAGHFAKVTWEGLPYVIDVEGPAVRDVLAMRDFKPEPRLGHLMALQAIRLQLEQPLKSVSDVKSVAAAITALETPLSTLTAENGEPSDALKDLLRAGVNLGRITQEKDVARASRELEPVLKALDAVTDTVLLPLLYGLALAPTGQPPAIFSSFWASHQLVPTVVTDLRRWSDVAWRIAASEPRRTGGTMLRGSLLALDVALAELRLRTAGHRDTKRNLVLAGLERLALVQSLTVRDRQAFGDSATINVVVAGLKHGRDTVASWASALPVRDDLRRALRAAAVDESRTNIILWLASRSPAGAFDALTATEIFRLGSDTELPDAWAGPAMPVDGCLCVRVAGHRSPEDVRGDELAAAVVTDLPLKLAEHLLTLDLPVDLVQFLLPAAMRDWLDQIEQFAPDDWEALAAWPRRVPALRMEDYLLFLVSEGTLSPPRDGGLPQ